MRSQRLRSCPSCPPGPSAAPSAGASASPPWRMRSCASRMRGSSAAVRASPRSSSSSLIPGCARSRRSSRARSAPAPAARTAPAAIATPIISGGGSPPRLISGLDAVRWQVTEGPVAEGGQVSVRGLPPLVVVQVLAGAWLRTRRGTKITDVELRAACAALRRQQVASIEECHVGQVRGKPPRSLLNALIRHVRLALANPGSEQAKDTWDLAVFGHPGRLAFAGITQPWLRQAAKRWAARNCRATAAREPGTCGPTSTRSRSCRRACGCALTTVTRRPPWAGPARDRPARRAVHLRPGVRRVVGAGGRAGRRSRCAPFRRPLRRPAARQAALARRSPGPGLPTVPRRSYRSSVPGAAGSERPFRQSSRCRR